MFLHRPGCFAIRDHFITKMIIESGDKSTDEVTFLSEIGLGLEDKEGGDVLFQGLFTLVKAFKVGKGVGSLIRVAKGLDKLLFELGVRVSGVFS